MKIETSEDFLQEYSFSMTQGKMNITVTGKEITIYEIIEDFKAMLLGAGFSPNLVERIEIGEEEENRYGN